MSCFEAAPYWLDEPENLVLAPGEGGRLICRANGNPKPSIQWLINGEPIESKHFYYEQTIVPYYPYNVFLEFMILDKNTKMFSVMMVLVMTTLYA